MILKRFLIIVSFIIAGISAVAQVFPVQVNTQLMPPFTPYLSDYTAPGAQKFMVQIRVVDPTLTDYICKLRITIEGVNITIRTKQTFVSQPITLEGGGTPQIFYGEDLIEYFNPNALDFSGISRSQYERGAKLKEGVYRFSVEVLDYNRGTVVSNKGGAVAWVILNDPPILNLPRNNSRTTIIDPTYIPFTWTPRHTGSPNASFTTEYKFRMVEVWPLTRNPYDAFLSQPTLYETTTEQTQLVYGISEPALIPGRKYAWQVQAVDVEGRDLFKNEGRSEVFVFQFGEALGIPDGLYLQNATAASLNVRWEAPTSGLDPTGYRLQYRPHLNRKSEKWYEASATDLWKTIDQLQPDTEYEVQLRAELNGQFSNYAAAKIFKTSPAASGEFACNSDVQPPALPGSANPLQKLNINDVIHAGGYEVHVRKVTSSGGTFSGEGGAVVPWLMGAKVHVTFNNISINEQLWLTAGEIKTVWNAASPFLVTVQKEEKSEKADDVGETNVTVATAEEIVVMKDAIIVTVTKDGDGNIVVYTSDGETKVLPKGKSYAIVDSAGNGYVTDKEGNIAKTTAKEAQEAIDRGNRTYTMALHFEKAGKYGYDKKKYDALAHYYQQLEGGAYIDWKSVPSGQQDLLNAVLEGTGYDPTKIRFELNSSPVTPITSENGKFTLNVQGKVDGAVEELLALYKGDDKDEVLGKINIATYKQVSKNLVIVPVGNSKLPDGVTATTLTKDLTEIYGQAIADWKVSMSTISVDITFPGEFNDGETGNLTNYTDDMKKVINAFGKLQDETYYIFLVAKPKSGTTQGYMPRSKQAGFIFVDKVDSKTIANAIAHEIGHGAFNLQHTFKEFPGLAEGTTDNLMDYTRNTGSALYKHQWEYVHDPQMVIGLFEDDADGALKYDCSRWFSDEGDCETVAKILGVFNSSSINGHSITLKGPNNIRSAELVAEDIELDEIDYHKIKIINLLEKGKRVTINPIDYEEYNQPYLDNEGKSDFQRGFAYRLGPPIPLGGGLFTPQPIIFKILLYHDVDEFADKKLALKRFLFAGKSKEPEQWPEDKIIIKITRIKHNDTRTVSILNIDNGKINGYTLELPKGSDSECQTTCSTARKAAGDCNRVMKGTYKFDVTTWSSKSWAINHSLRLENVPGREGILIHRGVNAKIWSEGCILAMRNNPTKDSDATVADERANDVDDSHEFCTEIHDYVKQREIEIKEKFNLDKVEKIVVIDEEFETND